MDKEINEKEENVVVTEENSEEIKEKDNDSKEEVAESNNEVENKNEEDKEEQPAQEEGKTYKVVKEKSNKKQVKTAVAVLSIVITIIIILLFSTVFALANLTNDKIIEGVTIKGIELVGLSREDAKLEITESLKEQLGMQISLNYNQYETSISPEQIEANYNIDKAIDEAYQYGRSENIIANNFNILYSMIFGKEIEIDFSYNDKLLTQMCEDISKKIPGAMIDTSYYIEGSNLIITKGTPGIGINVEELKPLIVNHIIEGVNKKAITIPIINKNPKTIDIDQIHQEVYKEPKDAYYTENPFKIYPHEDGIDFSISLEDARKLVTEDKTEYSIPLKYTSPKVTTNQIGTEAFPNLLSTFSTKYDINNRNRTTNLELASNKINGCVLLPGEEFSYNKVVGERTIAAGYKEAAIYSGGEVVDGLGGGICQISTTLYNVVVQANLDVTQRSNHQFITSYAGAGKDATVVYGAIDFKFVNTRKYPIKIVSSVKSGIAQMQIFGVKEDVEYDIKIETEVINTIPFSTKYVEDPTLDAGVERVKQYGAQGCKSIAYKVCRLNGAVVSKTVLSTDTYSAMTKIIRRGTKGANTVEKTEPVKPQTTPQTKPNTNSTTTTTTNKVNSSATTNTTVIKPNNNKTNAN